ncbi:carbohydrate binding domain-containing protein [Pedobacter glucosidilyticus]|uniref:carbohydrate binding domain-containing protein n=1 Tax=Pedobacter glucosidilyticus TaxID=1122941 RepID=UPI00047D5C8E|nr:carbohydrate binding domain-containing protein [Pedobacter glucosidilyticus]
MKQQLTLLLIAACITLCAFKITNPVKSPQQKESPNLLNVGDTLKLKGDKNLIWQSSDSSIARVDKEGLVTALTSGTVLIMANTKDGKVKYTNEVAVNLIKNSEFENDLAPWKLLLQKEAKATVVTDLQDGFNKKAAKIIIETKPANDFELALGQLISLKEGKTYEISFKAKSESKRDIKVVVQQLYPGNAVYFSQKVNLTEQPNTYKYNFKSAITGSDVRLKFNLGGSDKAIYIDAVFIRELL